MAKYCDLEINLNGSWQTCGKVKLLATESAGVSAPTSFEYAPSFLDQNEDLWGRHDRSAVSVRYPVSYELFNSPEWCPFLLDMIPSGAARRAWETRLALPNTPSSDWQLLCQGAGNPPGNVRVRTPDSEVPPVAHPGFNKSEIIKRQEEFIDYAYRAGAPVSGSSGAGGDAPKYLLRESQNGKWHIDGALPDSETKNFWIVKFPRGNRSKTDCLILKAEASYYQVAAAFGIDVYGPLEWKEDCLFIPRFDRVKMGNKTLYQGFESLYAAAGIAQFGANMSHEVLVEAIHKYSSNPEADVIEYVKRDVLNVALGNTDNHARNTALLKLPDGTIRLAPLYDFAPMFLDPSGIRRSSRWQVEEGIGFPDWHKVLAHLIQKKILSAHSIKELKSLAVKVRKLPELLTKFKTPAAVTEACVDRIATVERMLK